MRLLLLLLLSVFALSVSALAEDTEIPSENSAENLPIDLQFTWLSIARFQMLTDGEQDTIVVSSRDFLVFMMRATGERYFETCVKRITNTELYAIKNTILSVEPNEKEYIFSAVARISNRLFGLCSIPKQNQKDNHRA